MPRPLDSCLRFQLAQYARISGLPQCAALLSSLLCCAPLCFLDYHTVVIVMVVYIVMCFARACGVCMCVFCARVWCVCVCGRARATSYTVHDALLSRYCSYHGLPYVHCAYVWSTALERPRPAHTRTRDHWPGLALSRALSSKVEAAVTGATGSNGGKASTFCPEVGREYCYY